MKPYFADDHVELYHGDMREVLPALDVRADAVVTDPPYGETSLAWDRWPAGWVKALDDTTSALWCFGSMRMFFDHLQDFAGWKLAQDVVWEKHNGSGFAKDRFRRVHELALHFYRGAWKDLHRDTPRVTAAKRRGSVASHGQPAHTGQIRPAAWEDDGTRIQRSVISARSMHHSAIHPTEKPGAILDPLIRYSVRVGGLVLDPFSGSGSTLLTARSLGRRAVGIEADEKYCEAAARRLAEPDLFATPA